MQNAEAIFTLPKRNESILHSSYSSMIEPPEQDVWAKQTVQFVVENEEEIKMKITKDIRKRGLRYSFDISELYSDVLEYVLKYDDYSIEKAQELAEEEGSSTMITLESYVNGSAVHNVVSRYISVKCDNDSKTVPSTITIDDHQVPILDIIPDDSALEGFKNIENNLAAALRALECNRYRYGLDIFTYLYLKLAILDNRLEPILEVLDITSKVLYKVSTVARSDETIRDVLKQIVKTDRKTAIREIGKFVYGRAIIDSIICDRNN